MKCAKCGVAAPDEAKFCGACGEAMAGDTTLETAPSEPEVRVRKLTWRQWALIGCAGAVIVAAGVWGATAMRKPAEVPVAVSEQGAAQEPITEPSVTPISEPEIETPVDPITTPEKGSAERTEMLDAIRTYADNDDLVFVVESLYVQGDVALADVYPTPETDDGVFGRMWIVLRGGGASWFVDKGMIADESNRAEAMDIWSMFATEELLDAFFAGGTTGSSTTDMPVLETLSRKDMKRGLIFVLERADMVDIVRNTPSGPARVASKVAADYRFLADESRVSVTSNEMDASYFDPNNWPTLVLKVTSVADGVPADKTLPVTVEFVRAR